MKKQIIILFSVFLLGQLFASGTKDISECGTVETFYLNVEKQLGHNIEKYEKVIIDATYLYYYNNCQGKWIREKWDIAVANAVKLCKNNVAIATAKTGVFGEKLLQTLVVTTEDAISSVQKWIDSGSQKYIEKYNQ